MPTNRTRVRRHRKYLPDLTIAERNWLTGSEEPGENEFERMELELPIHASRIRYCIELLEKHPEHAEAYHPGKLDKLREELARIEAREAEQVQADG